jgi:thiamine-monophosphate kinase
MGEFELLERVRERLPAPGPRVRLGSGDDAAIVVPGGATATSVDALVDGVHFRREWSSPAQIGRKALAVALSDLAAMGAEAGEAYVVLGVPTDLDEAGCLEILDGIAALAAETGASLAGGDVTRAPALTLAMTVVGHAPSPERLVTRGGARPGDALVVTGELGGAAAGLLLLEGTRDCGVDPPIGGSTPQSARGHEGEEGGGGSVEGERGRLIARQLEPRPRLAAGRALAEAGATAMIDLSDGLGGDAQRLAEASAAKLEIEAALLPLEPGVDAVAAGAGSDPLELAASGGEDYELLAALPQERLAEAAEAVAQREGVALTRIGAVADGAGVEIRLPDGRLSPPRGFDQLR